MTDQTNDQPNDQMNDQPNDQTNDQTNKKTADMAETAERASRREEHAALVARIEAGIAAHPVLGELMCSLLERVDASEETGKMLLAMMEFARKHPDLALILAVLGRHE